MILDEGIFVVKLHAKNLDDDEVHSRYFSIVYKYFKSFFVKSLNNNKLFFYTQILTTIHWNNHQEQSPLISDCKKKKVNIHTINTNIIHCPTASHFLNSSYYFLHISFHLFFSTLSLLYTNVF